MRTLKDFSSRQAAHAFVQQVLGDSVTLRQHPHIVTPYTPDVTDLLAQLAALGYDEKSPQSGYTFAAERWGLEVANLIDQLLEF